MSNERNPSGHFVKGHPLLRGSEKGWFKKGHPKPKNAYRWGTKEQHPNWNGGRTINCAGYIQIYLPIHPYCSGKGYVFEHRLVMEKKLGHYLTRSEIIHHINGNRQDNRIENLKLIEDQSKHCKEHVLERNKNGQFKKMEVLS